MVKKQREKEELLEAERY